MHIFFFFFFWFSENLVKLYICCLTVKSVIDWWEAGLIDWAIHSWIMISALHNRGGWNMEWIGVSVSLKPQRRQRTADTAQTMRGVGVMIETWDLNPGSAGEMVCLIYISWMFNRISDRCLFPSIIISSLCYPWISPYNYSALFLSSRGFINLYF